MKMRTDIKFLISKYREQITTWRDGLIRASWAQITSEICRLEKVPDQHRPTTEGIRLAYRRLVSPNLASLPTNQPKSPVVTPSSVILKSPVLPKLATLPSTQSSPTNTRQTGVVKPSSLILPERVPDHIARGRSVLAAGNGSDEDLGLT